MEKRFKWIVIIGLSVFLVVFSIVILTVFFDEAVLTRKDTIYRVASLGKVVALTFDDGPSSEWTPQILDELRKANVKATFFMLGEHVVRYPEIAKKVMLEGHEIGNHTFDHHVLLVYKKGDLIKEVRNGENAIKNATGYTTKYFRPPKAWLTKREKKKIEEIGYKIILWSLNSKDWVGFDDKYIVKYIAKNIHPGDIILFHDSGGVLSAEGGDRHETLKAIPRLIEKLRGMGYKFVTITELLENLNNG